MLTDARVFQEDFVPADVVHRHDEIGRLAVAVEPLLVGDSGTDAFLFGPTGVGKTCVARYVLARLERELLDVETQYVNCWQAHTRFRLFYRLLEAVGTTFDVHRQSTPHDELLERLRAAIDDPFVVILDEVDQLEAKDALYELHALSQVTMILVSNREAELLATLDDRINSRLKGGPRLRFDRYSTTELTAILQRRVDEGLRSDAITRAQLHHVADAAAGDARVGLTILRTAAEKAVAADCDHVPDSCIEEAIETAKPTLRRQTLDQLTDHQRVLYDLIADANGIAPGTLYERYCQQVEEPRSRRMVRNYLSKLEHYDLVDATGQNRGRRYRAVEQQRVTRE
jgi:orc1/cdc6 family replication initiation protein